MKLSAFSILVGILVILQKETKKWMNLIQVSCTSTLQEEMPFQFPGVIFLLFPLHVSSQKSPRSSKTCRKLYTGSGLLFAPVTAGRVNRQKSLSPIHVPTSKNVRHQQGFFFLNFPNSCVCMRREDNTVEEPQTKPKKKHPM